jgi:hypothetical protein
LRTIRGFTLVNREYDSIKIQRYDTIRGGYFSFLRNSPKYACFLSVHSTSQFHLYIAHQFALFFFQLKNKQTIKKKHSYESANCMFIFIYYILLKYLLFYKLSEVRRDTQPAIFV